MNPPDKIAIEQVEPVEPVAVDSIAALIKTVEVRRNVIRGEIDRCVAERARINEVVADLRLELAGLDRIARATKPRRAKS